MKRKRPKVTSIPWTPFEYVEVPDHPMYHVGVNTAPNAWAVNSRYQVSIWVEQAAEPWGDYLHLSIRATDRSATHDWRDLQRIKNEIGGPEFDAIEVYPAESKLVDTSNQYHLFVFKALRIPLGFQNRLVADGSGPKGSFAPNAVQRPWSKGDRPADCKDNAELDAIAAKLMAPGTE